MTSRTYNVKLIAGVDEDCPQYRINGTVNDGKVNLIICDYAKEQIGVVDGVMGDTGNFSVCIRLFNSKYEKITVGAEVKEEFIEHGGISINEEIKPCYLEGIISKDVFARITLMSKEEGLSGLVVEGKIVYKK